MTASADREICCMEYYISIKNFYVCICPLRCAVHSPSLPDEVTESTTHCAKTETSRRYNSCTSQYTQLFIDISRIDASYTCSKQHQQGPSCLFEFAVNTITLITQNLYPYVFSLITDSITTLPTLLYVEHASNWILTP